MIRQKIIKLIQKATGEKEVRVEHPEEKAHGDYSTNIALQLKKDPKEIVAKLKSDLFEKVEVAEPGFINFFISPDYLQKQVEKIIKEKEKYGQFGTGKEKRVNLEFISANPTGSLHIGNGRNAFAGDVLANVLEKAGYKVVREYYINDAKNSKQIIELGKTVVGEGTSYLNDYLRLKIKNFTPLDMKLSNRARKSKIKNTIQKFKNRENIYSEAGYLMAQEIQKDNKDFIEDKLKIKFDKWISEEDFYKKNKIKKIFNWLKKKNLVYEKDGAWWLKTSQFGDKRDWVVVRETGEPTYLLSDIAYHKDKFDRGFDKVINIWGADHQAHVSKMRAAAKVLGFKGELDILILQLVTLRGKGKISKRTGRIITLEELIEEIGLDVARWFYLQKSLDTHMEIDLKLAKEQSEKNPVYYVQYAHARICSIIKKSKIKNQKSKIQIKNQKLKLLQHPSELTLIKQLIYFPEVVEDIARDYQVQRLPQYATDLAVAFHQFYRDCKVLTGGDSLQEARLALVLATKIVLKNTLDLMGVSAPEKM